MSHRKISRLYCAMGNAFVIILMSTLSVLSLITYRYELNQTLRQKVREDLKQYTQQSILLFDSILEDSFAQLDTIALFCGARDIASADVQSVLLRNNENEYRRIGISDGEGNLYVGADKPISVTERDYYQRAMAGERVISEVIRNAHNGRDVIVMAIPVKKGDSIVGTVCAQYDVQTFTALLGNSQFDGFGATVVIQQDGRMVSSYPGMELFDTFYDALGQQMEFRAPDTLESLRARVAGGESGAFTYYRNGAARYIYFSPTGVRDYTMVSLVLAESMDSQLREISTQALLLTLKNVCFYSVILVCGWLLALYVRRVLDESHKDPLTMVFNKVSAQAAIERFLDWQGAHACLFIDVDRFKEINDRYGHDAGDRLLKVLTERLRHCFRKSDVISRFGGDEFLVWMKNVSTLAEAEHKAQQLCAALREVEGIPITISIGIASYPAHGRSYEEVFKHADTALYEAKNSGRDRCVTYSPPTPP